MRNLFLVFTLFITTILVAQEQPTDSLGVEQVDVVKPYKPTISDAFKIKTEPKTQASDSVAKQQVQYQIYSVPVASTFTPSKGKAKGVVRPPQERIYQNYISVGFGNYTSPILEAFVHNQPDRYTDYGVFVNHNSSLGNISGFDLDSNYADTDVDFFYKRNLRGLRWEANANINHDIVNWYGLPDNVMFNNTALNSIEEGQRYLNIGLGGSVDMEDSIFHGGTTALNIFTDKWKSNEIQFSVRPKFEVPISSELINAELSIDFLNGKFDHGYNTVGSLNHSFLNLGVHPTLDILRDNLTVSLGTRIYYGFDLENSESKLYAYPNVTASYKVIDEVFTVYAGVTGDLHQNSYRQFANDNPFVSPTLAIAQSDEKYKGFLGAKGKFGANVGYNFELSYKSTDNMPLFIQNPTLTDGNIAVNNGYEAGNSFGVIYDDVQTLAFNAGLDIAMSKELKIGGNLQFANYSTTGDNLYNSEAWNLPALEASLFANYKGEKWFGGANIFAQTNRKDLVVGYGQVPNTSNIVTNDSFIDLNLNVGYMFTDRLSVFARANNILNSDYQPFTNFKVQGIQVLGGLTYKFDF